MPSPAVVAPSAARMPARSHATADARCPASRRHRTVRSSPGPGPTPGSRYFAANCREEGHEFGDVFHPLPQGGHAELDHVEAVVEIFAERSLSTSFSSERLVAATTCTSIGTGCVAPTGNTSRCWSTRSSLGWSSAGISPISSRNTTPPWAARRKMPRERPAAPVNAPFVAKQLALGERWHGPAAIHRDEGLVFPRAAAMPEPGPQFLARARLAGDQHAVHSTSAARSIDRRDPPHRGIAPEHPVGLVAGFRHACATSIIASADRATRREDCGRHDRRSERPWASLP